MEIGENFFGIVFLGIATGVFGLLCYILYYLCISLYSINYKGGLAGAITAVLIGVVLVGLCAIIIACKKIKKV